MTKENAQVITLQFVQGSEECLGHPKLFSSILLNHVFKTLGLTPFFTLHKSRSKIEYDWVGWVKLMCFGRLLNPASKLSTFQQKDDYYERICKTDDPFAIYRALDVLYDRRPNILKRINTEITKTIGRNTDLVFYDVTNFYFETEYPDENFYEDGLEKKGLRQRGVSKENRKSPIVQMGFLMGFQFLLKHSQGIHLIKPHSTSDEENSRSFRAVTICFGFESRDDFRPEPCPCYPSSTWLYHEQKYQEN